MERHAGGFVLLFLIVGSIGASSRRNNAASFSIREEIQRES
jgi:hypothetical protein